MKVKTIAFLLAGLVLYAGLTSITLMFYKDDPDQMNWQDREAFNTKYIYNIIVFHRCFFGRKLSLYEALYTVTTSLFRHCFWMGYTYVIFSAD